MGEKSEYEKFEDIYKVFFEMSNDSITVFKLDEHNDISNFVYANPATSKWTGFTKEEILNSSARDIMALQHTEQIHELVGKIIQDGFLTYEIEIVLKNGELLPVEFSSSFVVIGKERYVLTSGREIAERVETRREKEESMKEKTLLLDILTHDLRNYISILWSCVSQSLEDEDVTVEELKISISKAKASLTKTDALLDDISVLMKKDIEFTYDLRSVNVLSSIHKCLTNLEDMFPLKDIQINFERVDPQHNIFADMLFEQLIFNTLTNSVKNTPSQVVRIDIKTEEKPDNKIIISVADFGSGVPPEKRKKIFERYGEFRKRGSGSGLGLFIIQTLIERYDGQVWIENTIKGDYSKGTTFKLELQKAETEMFEFA